MEVVFDQSLDLNVLAEGVRAVWSIWCCACAQNLKPTALTFFQFRSDGRKSLETMKYFFIIFVFVIKIVCIDCVSYDRISGSFDGLNIVLENRLNASDCPQILKNLKVRYRIFRNNPVWPLNLFQNVLTSTSKEMYKELNNRFGKINVRIPR